MADATDFDVIAGDWLPQTNKEAHAALDGPSLLVFGIVFDDGLHRGIYSTLPQKSQDEISHRVE